MLCIWKEEGEGKGVFCAKEELEEGGKRIRRRGRSIDLYEEGGAIEKRRSARARQRDLKGRSF